MFLFFRESIEVARVASEEDSGWYLLLETGRETEGVDAGADGQKVLVTFLTDSPGDFGTLKTVLYTF